MSTHECTENSRAIVAWMGMIKLHSQSCSQTAVGGLGTETALRLPVISYHFSHFQAQM